MATGMYLDNVYLEDLVTKYSLNFDYINYNSGILHWNYRGNGTLLVIYEKGSTMYTYLAFKIGTGQIEEDPDRPSKSSDLDYAYPLLDKVQFLNNNFSILPSGFIDGATGIGEPPNVFAQIEKEAKLSNDVIRINTLPGPIGPAGPMGAPGVDGADWQADVVMLNATSYTTLCPPSSNNHIYILTDTSSAPVTITLECGCYDIGQVVEIKDDSANAFTNNITITPGVGNTIDGNASYTINKNSDSVKMILASIAPCEWKLFGDDACCAAEEVITYYTAVNYTNPVVDNVKNHLEAIDNKLIDLTTLATDIATNAAAISTTNGQVATILTDISTINNDITTLQTQVSSFSASITSLNTTVNAVQVQANANTGDITSLDTRVTDLEGSQATQTTDIAANAALIATLQTDVTTNTTNITDNANDITLLSTTVTTIQSDVTTLQATVSGFNAAISANTTNITTLQSDVTTLQSNVTTLQSDVSTNIVSISTNAANISTNTGNITTLQTDVTTAQGDITTLQTDVTTAQGDITTNTGDITNNTNDITNLQTIVTANQTAITTNTGDITTAQSDITTLQSQMTTAQADILSNASSITALQTNVTTNGGDIATLQSDVLAAEGNITTLQGQMTTAQTDIGNNSTSIGTNATAIGNNTTNITTNTNDIAELQNTYLLVNSVGTTTLTSVGSINVVEVDTTNVGGYTLELPNSSLREGIIYKIFDGTNNAGTNNIIVDGNGGTINGSLSNTFALDNIFICLMYSGSEWRIVEEYLKP